jgi:hypothetical protein
MFFSKDEKVFSLNKTLSAVPYGNVDQLFSEFYCYLLVAGLYREGESIRGIHFKVTSLLDKDFLLPNGSYRFGLSTMISRGLKARFDALINSPYLTYAEQTLLQQFAYIFTNDVNKFVSLNGTEIINLSLRRGFSDDMVAIARYVAVAFGQTDYQAVEGRTVPKLYISMFGNIHLAKEETVTLSAPVLRYGSVPYAKSDVTALWALLSSQIGGFMDAVYPGNELCSELQGLAFLTQRSDFDEDIPAPTFANALYIEEMLGVTGPNPVSLSAMFYRDFLYKTNDKTSVSREDLLQAIIDLMMEKMKEVHLSHLFNPDSVYWKLANPPHFSSNKPKRPVLFSFALESLDSEQTDDSEVSDVASPEDVAAEPTESDVSALPPAPSLEEAGLDENTIDLISFDKSGEGVDEDLYRSAVVALNDRLRSDDTLPVAAEKKALLDFWVNGWIYRTAIAATKNQIAFLGLQKYLKIFSTKG